MIVLDTHAWIRWLHPELGQSLPPALRRWLEDSGESLAVSVISCLEVSQLVKKERLWLPVALPDWFGLALAGSAIEALPLSPDLAWASTQLPGIHADPADRIIIATAQRYGSCLVSRDENIQKYPNLRTVWGDPPAL
jgi:PIN domain nuclease of toxin-antitoxin system